MTTQIHSILTGEQVSITGRGSTRRGPGMPAPAQPHELKAGLEALHRQVAELETALKPLRTDVDNYRGLETLQRQVKQLEAALLPLRQQVEDYRTQLAAGETRGSELQQKLEAEALARNETQILLAGARASGDGLSAQLEQERARSAALAAKLEQAIAAAAKPPVTVQPPPSEPPTYQVEVGDRDLNGRMRTIMIKPVITKGG